MDRNDALVSRTMAEVWAVKEALSQEMMAMTPDERIAYLNGGLQSAADMIGAKLVRNGNGSYSFVMRSEVDGAPEPENTESATVPGV